MSAPNGYINGSGDDHASPVGQSSQRAELLFEKSKALVAELEVPFDPSVIEWRVTNTAKDKKRGQIIPYANQRAYTDRLNVLLSPAGWTRKYAVHSSPNFQRSIDQKITAKVFVTCDLTIFGIGSHSATGEEWADDDNAGTSAEAQAFKRACSCFGLGRYLYYFIGTWVDLDARKRPKNNPGLPDWATPDGWRRGLRPPGKGDGGAIATPRSAEGRSARGASQNVAPAGTIELIRQIEGQAEPLGKRMYRGFLRALAQVWDPKQIDDPALLCKVLVHMQAAQRGLARLDAALERSGPEHLGPMLDSLKLRSLDQVDSLDILEKIVLAMEARSASGPTRS